MDTEQRRTAVWVSNSRRVVLTRHALDRYATRVGATGDAALERLLSAGRITDQRPSWARTSLPVDAWFIVTESIALPLKRESKTTYVAPTCLTRKR